ncbi:Transcription factor bHLH130 like [Actinidia chinensis var. chinensis]|uniref:Transcription factor bHLH130 like n=1 Tax=Actinidia chinensis var. chinensis TaxID=1590841 RepID=A0A2R6QQ10_ACTCC|nr:Transcription factor bHLH130 like [Actinidia chinensis var. chinensis]
MFRAGGSQAISRDSNLLFSSTFKNPNEELTKNKDFTSSDLYQPQQQPQPQPQHSNSSGLMRYRSAPSSFFASLVDGGSDGCEDFLSPQSSSPESQSMFVALMPSNGDSDSHDLQFPMALKHETTEENQHSASTSIYGTSIDMANHTNSMEQGKMMSGGNCSNLTRQRSSPAGFFSDLTAENGFGDMRDVGSFKVSNETNGKAGPSNRLNGFINFSAGPSSRSRFMPQIAENGNECIESSSPENRHLSNGNRSNINFLPSFQNDSWNDSGSTGLKRNRDGDEKKVSSFSLLESQNGDSRNYTTGLTHHLSLPKTSAEMATIEKILQFQQDLVPCKTRAKRGFATHPRSIAERVRRTRISERMRKLQELFPNMDKQANTADMLDLAVQYIKDLQKEVKTLTDTRAKCMCSSKHKQFPNPTA